MNRINWGTRCSLCWRRGIVFNPIAGCIVYSRCNDGFGTVSDTKGVAGRKSHENMKRKPVHVRRYR